RSGNRNCIWESDGAETQARLFRRLPEMARQMIAEIVRVIAGAVDQSRLAAAQKLHPHQVHARMRGDPAIVSDLALAVENREVKPGIVRAISARPDDRRDLAGL